MPPRPERLMLIHGAWAGPWVWDALIPELAAFCLRAEALALPGDGAHPIAPEDATEADFHDCIAQAIDAAPGPVALVGHSGGGMLVTAGAEAFPEKVTHAVWIAGMLVPDGRSFDDIQKQIMGPEACFGITPHVVQATDGRTSTVPPNMAVRYFFHDAPAPVARAAAARLTPQPSAGHRLHTRTGPRFAAMPKLYIKAQYDRSVIPAAPTAMSQASANVTVAEIASGHVPQLTHPARVAQIIADWLLPSATHAHTQTITRERDDRSAPDP